MDCLPTGGPRFVAASDGTKPVPPVNDRALLRCGKVCTVAVGLLGGAMALVLANMDIQSIYDQFQRFLGILTGGLGCLFFMGVFMKRVNAVGATTGLVVNYVVCFSLDRLAFAGKPHLLLYGAIGMAACLVVASVVSMATTHLRLWRRN